MLIEKQGSELLLSGEVSNRTLTAALFARFAGQCRQPEIRSLDLGGVTFADSVCISLLLEALRARGSGSLEFKRLPESVRDLAELYEIREWIQTR